VAIGGAVSVAAWAPLSCWPLILIAYGGLLRSLSAARTPLQAFALGLSFGIALHLVGHGWLFGALHAKAGLAPFPAFMATLAAAISLATPAAFGCFAWHLVCRPSGRVTIGSGQAAGAIPQTVAFALLMTLAEWARSLPFNGFTSLSAGYGLIDTWLAGFAPTFGVYGVSLAGYLVSGLIAASLHRDHANLKPHLILAALVLASGLGLSNLVWTYSVGTPLSFVLIQSGVAQQDKFQPDRTQRLVDMLVDQIERMPADLVVTSETAIPTTFNTLAGHTLSRLERFGRNTGSHLFLGVATLAANADGYNSLIHVARDSSVLSRYDKTRLMPFGEYAPIGFSWFTRALRIPFKDLSPGAKEQAPFVVNRHQIGTMICHEDLIGNDMRRWLPQVSLFLNPANLAWFDGSIAIAQRLEIVRMRAKESGRPILRVANTGISAHIDATGDVVTRLPERGAGELKGVVQPFAGLTPFARWGDWPVVLASAAGVVVIGLRRRGLFRPAPGGSG